YGSEEPARRRQAALQAAGFDQVRAEPIGDAPAVATWIDVASATPLAAADATALGAERVEPLDCATPPAPPPPAPRQNARPRRAGTTASRCIPLPRKCRHSSVGRATAL